MLLIKNKQAQKVKKYNKVFYIDENTKNVDYKGIINRLLQCSNIKHIIKNLSLEDEYIVQIPKEYLDDINLGKTKFLKSKDNGEYYPTIVSKNKIVKNFTMKRRKFDTNNLINNSSTSCNNIYIQNKINELTIILKETKEMVGQVINILEDNTKALLNAGIQGMGLALTVKDEQSRKQLISNGINNINIAQSQLFERLKRSVESFEKIPNSKFKQIITGVTKSRYFDKIDDNYDEIIENYGLYLYATEILALSYTFIDDNENIKIVYNEAINKIKQIDFSNLKTIENVHEANNIEKIYENSINYLSNDMNESLEIAMNYDCVEISLSKDKLLEVMSDGRIK